MARRPPQSLIPIPQPSQVLSDPKALVQRLLEIGLASKNPNTVRAYKRGLETFKVFLNVPSPLEALGTICSMKHGQAYAAGLEYQTWLHHDQKLSAATVNIRMAALKYFVNLARVTGLINWELEVPALKTESYRETHGPGKDPIQAVANDLEAKAPSDPMAARDLAIIRLLYNQALRRGEVGALDLEHFDPKEARLSILGKGRLDREEITLTERTKAALEGWIRHRKPGPGPLFTNFDPAQKGEGRLTDTSIYRIIKAYGLKRPHGLRHTGITEALDRTQGDLRAVQKFSRHKDPKIIMRYDDNRKDLAGNVAKLLDEDR